MIIPSISPQNTWTLYFARTIVENPLKGIPFFQNTKELHLHRDAFITKLKLANKEINNLTDKLVANNPLLCILEIFLRFLTGECFLLRERYAVSEKKVLLAFEKAEKIFKQTPLHEQTCRPDYYKIKAFSAKYGLRVRNRLARKLAARAGKGISQKRQMIVEIRQAQSRYLDDIWQESDRLEAAGFITNEVKGAVQHFGTRCVDSKIALARGLEIKAIFRKYGYDVFTHGQSQRHSIYNDLIQELLRIFRNDQYNSLGSMFRVPNPENPQPDGNMTTFRKNNPKNGSDWIGDNPLKEKLLCVDGYYWSTKASASALYYLYYNSNYTSFDTNIMKSILKQFIDDEIIIAHLRDKLYRIRDLKHSSRTNCGVFYLIGGKRDKVKEISYQSHDRWRPIDVEKHSLDDLQTKDNITDPPQYRFLNHPLAEETARGEMFAINCTPMSADTKTNYRIKLQRIIREAYLYKLLLNLKMDSPQEMWNYCVNEVRNLSIRFNDPMIEHIKSKNDVVKQHLERRPASI